MGFWQVFSGFCGLLLGFNGFLVGFMGYYQALMGSYQALIDQTHLKFIIDQLYSASEGCRSKSDKSISLLAQCLIPTELLVYLNFLLISLSNYKIMSQSQNSDVFPSSLYDNTDSILYLPSDPLQPFTPKLSGSQQTFDPFNQDFLRPQAPPIIPPSLTRLGPDRRKAYVLYDGTMYTEWVDWQLETDYGKISKLRWDANHHSEIQKQFH